MRKHMGTHRRSSSSSRSSPSLFKTLVVFAALLRFCHVSTAPEKLKKKERASQTAQFSKCDRSDLVAITISAVNNFGFVHTLYQTTLSNNPQLCEFVWFALDYAQLRNGIVDLPENQLLILDEIREFKSKLRRFRVVELQELDLTLPHELALKYELDELATAIKPAAFLYVFQTLGYGQALFFDNDIWVSGSLNGLTNSLEHTSILLTPHVTEGMPDDGKHQFDTNILLAGVYNFGFVGMANTVHSINFLKWWSTRLCYYGYVDVQQGMHYDQNWGMFIPAFLDSKEYVIERDRAYNVAYWNLHYTGSKLILIDGTPHFISDALNGIRASSSVKFFHFSGMSMLEEYDAFKLSRHQNRYTANDFPDVADIVRTYLNMLLANNALQFRSLPYGFDKLGQERIQRTLRRMYGEITLESHHNPAKRSMTCSEVSSESEFSPESLMPFFLSSTYFAVDLTSSLYVSKLEEMVWKANKHIHSDFPSPFSNRLKEWRKWFFKQNLPTFLKSELLKKIECHNRHTSKRYDFISKNEYLGVNMFGYFDGAFGVAHSARRLALAMQDAGLTVQWISVTAEAQSKVRVSFNSTRDASMPINLFVINADMTDTVLQHLPSSFLKSKYNIAYWAWELEAFPSQWTIHATKYDEIWTMSNFVTESVQQALANAGIDKAVRTFNIPYLDHSDASTGAQILSRHPYLDRIAERSTFTFLFVFDFLSIMNRKNPAATIAAFREAFPQKMFPSVLLVLKTLNRQSTNADVRSAFEELLSHEDGRILTVDATLGVEEMNWLNQNMDCFVSLHRSEGYGISLLDTLGRGKQLITTNYGGITDVLREIPDSFPCVHKVNYTIVEVGPGSKPYDENSIWADPIHVDAVRAFRHAYQRHRQCQLLKKDEQRLMLLPFSIQHVGMRMFDRLHAIAKSEPKMSESFTA